MSSEAVLNNQDVMTGFKPEFSKQHGYAWFFWPPAATARDASQVSGWYSVGGLPALPFRSFKDLDKNVIWWTNLSKPESWTLGKLSYIKHAGFLGPDFLSLMSEWGLPQNEEAIQMMTSFFSEIFARLAEWMNRWHHKMSQGEKGDWVWGDGDFCDILGEILGYFTSKEDAHPILNQAFIDVVEQPINPQKLSGKRKISLIFPRVKHNRHLWGMRYPYGPFKEVLPQDWPQDISQRWKWIAQQSAPVLVRFDEVQWKSGYENEAALWWGLRGKRFAAAAMESVWLTGEEALEMQQWIEADPVVALKGTGWTTMASVEGWPLDERGPLYDNSITTGLLCEAMIKSASSPLRTATKRIKSGVSARQIWWSAANRRACFRAAHILMKKGFDIISYGNGNVVVAFDPAQFLMNDWISALNETGLSVPMLIASQMPIQEKTLSSKDLDIWLKKISHIENWLFLDRLLWPWMGHNKQELKPILEHAMKGLGYLEPPSEEWGKEWKNELRIRAKAAVQNIVS